MDCIVCRVHGWLTNGRNSVPIRRLYVDQWQQKALVQAAQDLDAMVEKLPLLGGPMLVSRGVVLLEIGRGAPEKVAEFAKEVQPTLTPDDIESLMNSMFPPSTDGAKPRPKR